MAFYLAETSEEGLILW